MATLDRSSAPRPPASSPAIGWAAATIAVVLGVAGAASIVVAGCSYSSSDNGPNPGFHDGDATDEADAIVIDVANDTTAPNPLCGAITCNPDDFDPDAGLHTCTPFDSGADGDAPPSPPDSGGAGDSAIDTSGSGGRNACRVVKSGDKTVTACAPAGFVTAGFSCTKDADCSPGLACVGPPTFGTCEPYCCTSTADKDPCHDLVPSRYCTPLPLAQQPDARVPVCVPPEQCKLVSNDRCVTGTTCTVVDSYGDTDCLEVGTLTELQCCSNDPADGLLCAKGFACLGPIGDRVCRKLCKIADTTACSGTGHCEAQSTFPAGFGICTIDVTDGASDGGHCGR